jgi:ubiquinol-cytochrome c reductase cytochrome c1 subunit
MTMWRNLTAVSVAALLSLAAPVNSASAAEAEAPPKQEWSFHGPTGTYDRAALQRGFKVYREVCAACHGMDRVHYRDLAALGYSEGQIKAIAGEYTFSDGPNDEGEMFDRPGRPGDRFKNPYDNRQAAMYANNGAYPPDMSLLVKARKGGADYVYGILTGYEDAPADVELMQGQYWNRYMAGHVISMAPPLSDGQIAYDDGTEGTVAQYSHDVAHFLTWAAEPHMEVRKRTGVMALLFLLALSGIMYAVKRRIWANQH